MIWEHAKQYDYIVTTKDTDYLELSEKLGFPPKLILVRIDNAPTVVVSTALRERYDDIAAFVGDDTEGVYNLYTV